jgi:hypothetical protein
MFLSPARISNIMAYQSNVVANPQTVEYGKFLEIQGDTRFPAISVIRDTYPDTNTVGLTSLSVYPKYAVIAYLANPDDIKVSLSAENINVNLADVENILNVISPNVGTINTNVGTINTNVADIETLLIKTNTLVDSASALLGKQLGVNGVVFCQPSNGTVTQNFNAVQVLSACKFSAITIANSTTTGLTNYELPQNFILSAPITSLALTYGAVIAFK